MRTYEASLIPETVRCVCLNVLYPTRETTPDGLREMTVLEDWRGRRVDVCPSCGADADAILEAEMERTVWMNVDDYDWCGTTINRTESA